MATRGYTSRDLLVATLSMQKQHDKEKRAASAGRWSTVGQAFNMGYAQGQAASSSSGGPQMPAPASGHAGGAHPDSKAGASTTDIRYRDPAPSPTGTEQSDQQWYKVQDHVPGSGAATR